MKRLKIGESVLVGKEKYIVGHSDGYFTLLKPDQERLVNKDELEKYNITFSFKPITISAEDLAGGDIDIENAIVSGVKQLKQKLEDISDLDEFVTVWNMFAQESWDDVKIKIVKSGK